MIKFLLKEENTIVGLIVAHEKKPGPAAEYHSGLYSDKHKGVFKGRTEMTAKEGWKWTVTTNKTC